METNIRLNDGEFEAYIDGVLIGIRGTHQKAFDLIATERAKRAAHPAATIEYAELANIKAAGMLGEFVADLNDENLSGVAHMLVMANNAAGRVVEYDTVYARLAALRDVHRNPPAAPAGGTALVAGYETAERCIVVRTAPAGAGAMVHRCDTWIEVDTYMRTVGAR